MSQPPPFKGGPTYDMLESLDSVNHLETRLPDSTDRTRISWKLWASALALVLLLAAGSTLFAVQAVAGALQSTTRSGTRGYGGPEDQLDKVSACCRFSVVAWETQQLTLLALSWLLLPAVGHVQEDELATARRFFTLTRALSTTELAINRTDPGTLKDAMAEGYQNLTRERQRLELPTQRVLAALISRRLEAEGLAQPLPLRADLVWPPVAFTIKRPPSVLVVSPRNEIKLERTTALEPGLTDQQVIELEQGAEALGWSSLVEPTGGYSTYPTIITDSAPLSFALQAAAHEWTHTYLFFHPLGFNYFKSQEMRTINETVANLVGQEVSKKIMSEYFDSNPPAPRDRQDAEFDFPAEMRKTRLEAERLLAQGNVDEAEGYMEERRKVFVEHGYNIRKLNQAYFAFHGTYADSPASVSPIGSQLAQLLEKSGSVGQFVKTLAPVGSFGDYQALLQRHGISEARQ